MRKIDYAIFRRVPPIYPSGVEHRIDNEFMVHQDVPLKEAMNDFLQEEKAEGLYYHNNSNDDFLLLEYRF